MGLGLRQAAIQLKISHVALHKAVKAGRVTKEADGTFDVDACRRALAQNSNLGKQKSARAQARSAADPVGKQSLPTAKPAATEDAPEDDSGNYSEACRRLEWLKVQKAELDLAKKRGELFPISEVNAFVAGMITRARDGLLRIDCDDRTRREINRCLGELSEFVG